MKREISFKKTESSNDTLHKSSTGLLGRCSEIKEETETSERDPMFMYHLNYVRARCREGITDFKHLTISHHQIKDLASYSVKDVLHAKFKFNPKIKIKKISSSRKELSIEKIEILIR